MKTKTLVIIIATVLAISLAASAILYFGGERKTAEIYVDGELLRSIDLAAVTETQTFTVETEEGINVIEVERGRIRVSDADCPDRVCVRSGWLSEGDIPIVCLPHGLVIRLSSGGEVDSVSR